MRRQVGLHRSQVLLDQPVDGRREAVGVEAGERGAVHSARAASVSSTHRPLEQRDVDRGRRHVQAIGDTGTHDRVRTETLAQARDVRLERLVRGARRLIAPHQPHDPGDRHCRTGRQGEHGQHGLALRWADVDRFAVVGRRGDAAEEPDLHWDDAPFRCGRQDVHVPERALGAVAVRPTPGRARVEASLEPSTETQPVPHPTRRHRHRRTVTPPRSTPLLGDQAAWPRSGRGASTTAAPPSASGSPPCSWCSAPPARSAPPTARHRHPRLRKR